MPDPFFTSQKNRKRKRPGDAGPSSSKKMPRNAKQNAPKGKRRDEELDSDKSGEETGNIDDMDLRAPSDDEVMEDDEDPDETPAEKRLRLAQLYLDSVKKEMKLGAWSISFREQRTHP